MDIPAASRRPIRWWNGVVVFAAAVAFQIGFGTVLWILGGSGALGKTETEVRAALYGPGSMAFQVVVTAGVLSLLAIAPLRLSRRDAGAELRLRRPRFATLVVAAIAVIPLGFVVDEVTYLLGLAAPAVFDPSGLERMAEVFSGASIPGLVAVTAAVTIGPALGEELLFRGYLLRAFSHRSPAWLAVGVTAVLFGAIHMNALQGAGAFLIGLYLGFLVVRTGSLWPAVVAHGLNNLTCAVFARVDPQGAGTAFASGHHPAVVIVSLVGVAAAIAYVATVERGGSPRR